MGDLKTLSEELGKLQKQIDTILCMSGYKEYEDLSGLSDYEKINTPDRRQLLEEYRNILFRLSEVNGTLQYFSSPILEVGRLHMNSQGRYETQNGYYYTSGSGIEFLRTEEVYNYNTGSWENVEIWTASSVESKEGKYYIVGYPDLDMSGLVVRVRK